MLKITLDIKKWYYRDCYVKIEISMQMTHRGFQILDSNVHFSCYDTQNDYTSSLQFHVIMYRVLSSITLNGN